ncbi:MAG: pentapeptide repeat-containing protein [Flavobacteriales bacterium]|nr:pentapeptide repeat-containing protein [Flavobacteriales bacterium]
MATFVDELFSKNNIQAELIEFSTFENCVFDGCYFSGANFSNAKFIDCEFKSCDLSLVKTNQTALRHVKFFNCKMLGLRFDEMNNMGMAVTFENCNLSHSSFYVMKLQKSYFKDSLLIEVDFTEADLASVKFENCNMLKATFVNTILENADLRSAYNFSINPTTNRIKGARFSSSGLAGLLDIFLLNIE